MANRFLNNIRINDAYTFPASDGNDGQVITTDGAGNLAFENISPDAASVIYRDNFTGDGSTTTFDLQNSITDEDQTQIYIDGVYQEKSTYSISGTTITFTTAPISGHSVEVISISSINTGPTVLYQDNFTGNGSNTAFTLGQEIDNEIKTFIFLNGVYQFKNTYTVDGATLTFDTAPANGVAIEVVSIASAVQSDSLEAGAVIIPVKNTHTASIAKGTPVYITGNVGSSERLQIAPADASNSAKMPAAGLLLTTLAVNAEGYVITGGYLRNLTTDTIDGTSTSSNDTVYVKPGGGLTMTKPTGSNLIQNVAKVARSASANAGSLLVSSILRTNDVPNLTTGKIWVGDSNTVESTVIHLDESNNRLGINNNSPNYSLDVTGDANISSNVIIGGNLTVDGTQTILNTQTVEVEDNILQLNTTQGSPDTATATTSGISIYRGDGVTQASFIFDDVDDTWDLTNNLAVAGKILVGTGATAAASLNAYTQTVSTNLYSALRVIENSTASSYWDIGATGGASTLLNFYHNSNTTPKLTINSSGNIGVGVTPESWGTAGDTQVIRISTMSSISEAFDGTQLASNFYYDGSGDKYIQSDFASSLLQIDGEFRFRNASSGTAGGTVTWNERMRIDSSGSVGIGVTPSNWANLYGIKALDLSTGGAVWGTTSNLELANNLYYDTTDVFKYKASGIANFIALNSNGIVFSNAPSGTAGSNATLTERMRIDVNGAVGIGRNTASYRLSLLSESSGTVQNGVYISAGTGNSNHAFYVENQDGSAEHLAVRGDGQIRLNASGTGNVLISTTVDSTYDKLQVIGNAYIGGNATRGVRIADGGTYASMVGINQAVTAYTGLELRASGTNGQLFLSTNGNVGISTTSPTNGKLEVQQTATTAALWVQTGGTSSSYTIADFRTGTNASALAIKGNGNVGIGHTTPQFGLTLAQGTGDGNRIGWEDGANNKRASIICSSSTDALQFHTGTSDTERMRINSSGDVELKPSNPASMAGADTNYLGFRITQTNAQSALLGTIYGQGVSGWGGRLVFRTKPDNGSPNDSTAVAMIINENQYVGIGETSPTRKLHIVNTDDTRGILVENTLSTSYAEVHVKASREFRIGTGNSSSATEARDRFYVYDATAGTHRFTIDSAGNVGIGQTSPRSKLDVNGIITQEYGYVYQVKQASTEKYYYSNGASYNAFGTGVLGIGTTFDPIQLATNNSVRMSILNSGEFCIGSTETAIISTDTVHSIGQITRSTLNSSYWARLVMQERQGNWISFVNGNGVHYGTIAVSGSGVSYGSNSDYRLKENVVEMTGALDRLTQLKPIRFNFIIDADTTVDGFLAHEVQDIVPEAVTGEQDGTITTGNIVNNNGTILEKNVIKPETLETGTSFEAISIQPKYQQLDPAKLVPLLVGAIKELKAEIETLKLQING